MLTTHFHLVQRLRMRGLYLHSSIRLHGVVFNQAQDMFKCGGTQHRDNFTFVLPLSVVARSRDRSVIQCLGYGPDDRGFESRQGVGIYLFRTIGVLEFDSRWGLGIFLFTTVSRTALEPTHPPIQRVPEALSLGVKRPGC
jgi:hypothetical protein